MISPLGKTLRRIRTVCEKLGLRWFLFGARAAIAHGVVRATDDIDVTVHPGRKTSVQIAAAFVAEGFSLVYDDPTFVARTRVLRLRDRNLVNVDVVLGGAGYDEIVLSRAVRCKLGGVFVPVASPEDVIVMKVLASRDVDRRDVHDLLAVNSKIRLGVIRDTLGQLEEALDQSDLVPAFEAILARASGWRG